MIRKTLLFVTNLAKFIVFFSSVIIGPIAACAVDSEGKGGVIAMIALALSFVGIFVSAALEIFAVKYLLKPNERLKTLFDFACYGRKSSNYIIPIIHRVTDEYINHYEETEDVEEINWKERIV